MTDAEKPNEGELILYQTQEGAVRIEVLYESETFWLNQKKIAELFGVDLRTISYHLGEIYASGELSQDATLRKIRRVQKEGNREVTRQIEFYNLDAIISVGYRVNSSQATQFRIWATQTIGKPKKNKKGNKKVPATKSGEARQEPWPNSCSGSAPAPKPIMAGMNAPLAPRDAYRQSGCVIHRAVSPIQASGSAAFGGSARCVRTRSRHSEANDATDGLRRSR